jgi:hypothetical protein
MAQSVKRPKFLINLRSPTFFRGWVVHNAYKQLLGAKLELNNNYQIDNDKVLTIVGIDNDDDEKPFKVSVRGKGGESNSGNIGFDALKNLLYNKSLFENKKGQR